MKYENYIFNAIEDYIDYREQHEDYFTVMQEYSNTELFKEIIHFMNISFPEWNSNRGLGSWSAEFVLTTILNTDFLECRDKYSQREMLETLYVELAENYKRTKEQYNFVFNNRIIDDFHFDKESELDEKEHLPYEDFSVFYDDLFLEYKKQKLQEVTYNFEEDLLL